MKLAISGENLGYTDDLRYICGVLKSHGVRYLELWPLNCVPAGKDSHPRLFSNKDLNKTKEILDEFGISVCCVTFGGAFVEEFIAQPEFFSDELAKAVEAADFFGAKLVNNYCHLICQSDTVDNSVLERYFRKGVERAKELGVTVVLENEAHDMVRTPDRMKKAVEYFNCAAFKTNYDATNYYQASFEAFPLAYDILKDDIAYVHIKNGRIYDPAFCKNEKWIGGELSGANAPGKIYYTLVEDGCVNIHDLLLRLQKDGYDGYCTLEPHSVRDEVLKYYAPELEYLRRIPVFDK